MSILSFDDYNDNATDDRYHTLGASSDPNSPHDGGPGGTSSPNPGPPQGPYPGYSPDPRDAGYPGNQGQPNPSAPAPSDSGGGGSSSGGGGSNVEDQLKRRLGSLYDPSILGDYVRNASYGAGANANPSDQSLIDRLVNRNLLRGSNGPNSTYVASGNGGYTVGPTGRVNNPFGAPVQAGSGRTAGAAVAGGSGGGGGNGFSNSSPQFTDPASALLENYALDRFGQRMNPAPTSGTAMYEQYAKQLVDTLKSPVYSPQDEAVLKTKATNAIMAERDQTKQRWLEELSARGIAPSSGVALDGLQRIEQHFEGLRTTAEAQFAANAIDQTRAQRFQALDTLGQLSQEQEGRLTDAGNFARVPYDLSNQAFNRNLQLVGAGGSPSDLYGNAMTLAQFQNNSALQRAQLALQQQAYSSGNSQAMTAALLQYLGYLFG